MINNETLFQIRLLTEINSLTQEQVQGYWDNLRLEINNYNDEIQYAEEEINEQQLLRAALVEDIILSKNGLWGDTLEYHKDKKERYINTLTGLGI